ncbi:hypothetical protein P691DRAFT_622881, partial [Macrolepiota fuliginosa MF-IS2]
MNFLDTYDIQSSSSTPPPDRPQQSLNEEVNQVIGQLGRFWGGFRKQSQTAFETARKDLGDVVTQAQKELNKLTTPGTPSTAEGSNTTEEGTVRSTPGEDKEDDTPTSSSVATLNASDPTASTSSSTGPSDSSSIPQSAWSTQTLFSRLQSALPPNVVSAVQDHIPESLKHASENIDLAQIRTNLLSEVQRIQGVTRAQAEEYVHKSEALLREAVKEAQEVLKDAVKVIPPEEAPTSASGSSGLVWDGTDMWMLPTETDGTAGDATSGSEKGKGVDGGAAAVATRAEALLRRLRHDPAIMRMDPGADEATKEKYASWLEKEVNSKDGGIESEEWQATITKNLDGTTDGKALAALQDSLVPSELTEAEFWQRFFFRTHQIKEEEEKRKALLQVTTESEDDFAWDDEDSDEEEKPETKPPTSKDSTPSGSLAPASANNPSLAPPSSSTTRESSLDSFDVVSSANASVSGEAQKQLSKPAEEDDED